MSANCPICEQGVLVGAVDTWLYYSICTHCKSEVADSEQMKIDKHSYICDCHRAYGKKCRYPEKYREGGCR